MSYQPEERYWTDYLRIALPVVGLLLMLGLFWFWAESLISDDDSDTSPTNTPSVAIAETAIAGPTNTVVPTTSAQVGVTEGAEGPSPTPNGENGEDAEEPSPTPEDEEPPSDSTYQEGDTVVVTDEGVNLRPDASTEGDPVTQLAAGTVLEITGPAEEGGDFLWWPVTVVETGDVGYIADDYVASSEE